MRRGRITVVASELLGAGGVGGAGTADSLRRGLRARAPERRPGARARRALLRAWRKVRPSVP